MEENLISKKDLLALTGISYGALYRWKRKQLIPEEWFMKKSTFTGPETFFPREKVLERIAKIQEMKEDLSLDDLAKTFSGKPPEILVTMEEATARGILSPALAGLKQVSPKQELDFFGILYLAICDRLLSEGLVSFAEAEEVLSHLLSEYASFAGPPILCLFRKTGVLLSLLKGEEASVAVDRGAKEIARIVTGAILEDLISRWETEK